MNVITHQITWDGPSPKRLLAQVLCDATQNAKATSYHHPNQQTSLCISIQHQLVSHPLSARPRTLVRPLHRTGVVPVALAVSQGTFRDHWGHTSSTGMHGTRGECWSGQGVPECTQNARGMHEQPLCVTLDVPSVTA